MVRKSIVIFGIFASSTPAVRAQMPMVMHDHSTGPAATLTTLVDRGDLVFDLGPIDVPARAMHDDIRQPAPLMVAAGLDGWLRGYSVELIDSAGQPVPQAVVHHVNVIIPQRRELFSPIMLRLAAAGA